MEEDIAYKLNEAVYKGLLQTAEMSVEEAIDMRLKGDLPVLDICGHPFYVEVYYAVLRPKDNLLSPGLDLNYGGSFSDKDSKYSFYYHIPSMSEAIISPDITELPNDVVLIKFPCVSALDPLSMARINGEVPKMYLDQYPMKMYSKAEVIPLEKSPLADLVKANLKKKGKIKQKVKQRKKGI